MDYAKHWQGLLTAKGTEGVDLIASLTEDAVNNFLAKHFELDKIHYKKTIKKDFTDGNQTRSFSVVLEVGAPLKVDFPPLAARTVFTAPAGWNDIDHRPAGDRGRLATPNVRIVCDSIKFYIKWSNLHPPPPDWDWTPTPLRLLAEAYLWLDYFEGRYRLMIEPTRVKFDPATPPRLQPATNTSEEKFNDLLVIALNIAAYEFGPSLVRAIEIPAFNVAGLPIYPAYLNLSADMITIGAAVDQPKATAQVQKKIAPMLARYMALLEADLEAAGGASRLFPDGGHVSAKQAEATLAKALTRSRGYVAEIRKQSSAVAVRKKVAAKRSAHSAVAEGLAAGLNEYFANSILPHFIDVHREGQNECDLGGVKGGIRWWFKLANPAAQFQNDDIVGSADIDVGGAIFACVRKFWDCSYRWECSELALGVTGRPAIRLITSNVSDGIEIQARIVGAPSFTSNLPPPFDAVAGAVARFAIDAIVQMINLILSLVKIVVVSKEVSIPDVKTRLRLSAFNRFSFERDAAAPVALPAARRKFLAVKASVEAIS